MHSALLPAATAHGMNSVLRLGKAFTPIGLQVGLAVRAADAAAELVGPQVHRFLALIARDAKTQIALLQASPQFIGHTRQVHIIGRQDRE